MSTNTPHPSLDRTDRERIATDRLLLRRPTYADGPDLHALLSDPVVCRFGPDKPATSLVATRFLIADLVDRWDDGLRSYVVARPSDVRRPIGFLHVSAEEELGGLMSPRCGGRGYATEALFGVTKALGLSRAWAIVDAEHAALIRVLSKVGIHPCQRLPRFRVHPVLSAGKRDCLLMRQGPSRPAQGSPGGSHQRA